MREKVLAARRGGIRHILLPARNRGDLEELRQEATEGLRFTFVETVGDVLFALFPPLEALPSGDGVDMSPGPHAEEGEEEEDVAGGSGGRGRGAGFQPVHGHALSKGRGAGEGGIGWEAEDVSGGLLESFL